MKRKRFNTAGHTFWDKEYKAGNHLALSNNPSEDLVKFTRWLTREYGREYLNQAASVLDLGCGNGRNLLHLARTFGMKGVGLDTSSEAIAQAKALSVNLPIEYQIQNIANPLLVTDSSQALVLDMMTSHFLRKEERLRLREEIARVLKPGGWLFWKTFLLDHDEHAKRLLQENPADEEGSYIHPKIGLLEHVFTEKEIENALSGKFTIQKITKSHGHL
ncbi:MAG: class I SAM-dependent methyltransferase, partial [bacterium]|nr:class I SAM-dependent methyltransferase [bacterium]